MSYEYAMSRVRDALEKSEGNHLKAQRTLLSWIEKDHSLLLGLSAPHLQGIISYALKQAALPEKKAMPKHVDLPEEATGEFGEAMLQSLKGGRAEGVGFAQPSGVGGISKPGKASQSHIDAITKLAGGKKDKE